MTIDDLKIWIQNANVEEYTFVFDLDGTLVNTDVANRRSYFQAARDCNVQRPLYNPIGRFTRASLRYSHLSPDIESKIVAKRETLFSSYLQEVQLLPAANLLNVLPATANVLLVTKCSRVRAMEIVNNFGWQNRFSAMYFVEDVQSGSKVDFVLRNLQLDASRLVWIEDSELEIRSVYEAQIPVVVTVLRSHVLFNNAFLDTRQLAYCHDNYVPGIWTYINVLKNDDLGRSQAELEAAVNTLKNILREDIPVLHKLLGGDELVVVPIPRSKALCAYQPSQLMLVNTIRDIANELSASLSIVDGGDYLIRHTDTPTTHLGQTNEDGSKTYPGITKETCTISSNVQGKNILLVDDIYTAFVNIDEDAIQALYDVGARHVTLYTLGKTTH